MHYKTSHVQGPSASTISTTVSKNTTCAGHQNYPLANTKPDKHCKSLLEASTSSAGQSQRVTCTPTLDASHRHCSTCIHTGCCHAATMMPRPQVLLTTPLEKHDSCGELLKGADMEASHITPSQLLQQALCTRTTLGICVFRPISSVSCSSNAILTATKQGVHTRLSLARPREAPTSAA